VRTKLGDFDRIGVDVLREPQAVVTKTKHKMKGRDVGGRVNGCGRKTSGRRRKVDVAIVVMFNRQSLLFIQRGLDGGISDAVNHHLQFGEGIDQFGLISIITLKNY
jgi:hypothetical protein